nr:hypothetical protein 1573p1_00006 [Serratia marcescens]
MNHILRTTLAALTLTLAGYAAADEINRQNATGLIASGHISAGNLSTPGEVADRCTLSQIRTVRCQILQNHFA